MSSNCQKITVRTVTHNHTTSDITDFVSGVSSIALDILDDYNTGVAISGEPLFVTWSNTYSANLNSSYNTVKSNSADWNYQGTDIKLLTGGWENVKTVVQINSSLWILSGGSGNGPESDPVFTAWLGTSSTNIQSVFSTVNSNSAVTWNYQGTDIKVLTSDWNNTKSVVETNSAIWAINTGNSAVNSFVNTNSAGLLSVDTVVKNNSALWILSGGSGSESDPIFTSWAQTYSGNYQISYNNLISNSAAYLSTRNFDYIDFYLYGSNNKPLHEEGRLFYNYSDNALSLYVDQPDVTLNIGQELWIKGNNSTADVIPNGSVVFLSGAHKNLPVMYKALANRDSSSSVVGVVTHDVAAGEHGYISTYGTVSSIDTTGFIPGSVLYLSPTVSGGLTNIKPDAPYHAVKIGYALNSLSNGKILVNPANGFGLYELHDVYITNIQNDDTLVYNALSSIWYNTPSYKGTDIKALTSIWNNTTLAFNTQSANNISTFNTLNSNSANYQAAYNNLISNSATYLYNPDLSLSSNWQSTYNTVQSNSSNWGLGSDNTQVNSFVNSNSADIVLINSIVKNNSALWILSGGSGSESDPIFTAWAQSFSGNYQLTYNNLISNSAAYLTSSDTSYLAGLSSQWSSSYTVVNSNSSNWNYSFNSLLTGGYVGGSLSAASFNSNYIDFNVLTSDPAYTEGRLFYNGESNTLGLYVDNPNVLLNIGQEMWILGVNKTPSTIPNGSVVYLSGAQGNRPIIYKAIGNSEITSSDTIGLVTHDINSNEEGYITTHGIVSNINTTMFNVGDILYLSPTVLGGITNIKPVAPNHTVKVGYALNSTNNGKILVSISNGLELYELHDVYITNIQNDDTLVYNTLSSIWINSPIYKGTDIKALTSIWQDTSSIFSTQSANNFNVYNTVNSNSADWNNISTTVKTNSSLWILSGGSGAESDPIFSTWAQTYSSVYTTVNANSSLWSVRGKDEIWIDAGAMLSQTSSGAQASTLCLSSNFICFDCFDFDAGSTEFIQFKFSLPLNWDQSIFKSRLYWTCTTGTTGTSAVMAIQAAIRDNNNLLDQVWGNVTTITDRLDTLSALHITDITNNISFSGTPTQNGLLFFRIYRDVNNVNDNIPNDFRLLGAKLQYGTLSTVTIW